jgi:hypothetical protein
VAVSQMRLAALACGCAVGCITYIKPSVEQLQIRVPSCTKSTPLTGSECAGSDLMRRAARTSQRNTASSWEPLQSIFPFGEKASEYM